MKASAPKTNAVRSRKARCGDPIPAHKLEAFIRDATRPFGGRDTGSVEVLLKLRRGER